MYKSKKITVILPCRNEGAHLPVVIKRIPKIVDEIIVVSNRSTDNTVSVAKQLGLKVFEDDRTLNGIGYGYAHMTGIEKAKGDIIIGIDGDATYPIEGVAKVLDYMLAGSYDFISCNRYPLQDNTVIPFKLRLGVLLLNLEVRVLYGIKVKDILSGMWLFKKKLAPELGLTMGDWNLSPQIKINAGTNPNIKFGEYSIAQHRRHGETKQRYFSTGLSHIVWIFKNRITPQVSLGSMARENLYIARFLVVGVLAFVFNYSILDFLIRTFGLNRVVSEVIAMVFSLQLTFLLHNHWTYAEKAKKSFTWRLKKRYFTYMVSNSFSAVLTIALFALFAVFLAHLPALALAALITMVWNFTINKVFIWRRATEAEAE